MEKKSHRENSTVVLAFVLIGIGMIWALRKLGIYLGFPEIHFLNFFNPFRSLADFILSWQVILIIIGLILMAGRRSIGLVLVLIGGLFLLPEILFFPHFSLSLLLPLALIAVGVVMVARRA